MTQIVKSTNLQKGDLDLINKFTLENLTENEIFTFSVILCTNEIDRDYESFTKNTIEKLAPMFVGKTGIFNHHAKAQNQTARIFKTEVEQTNTLTSFGEPKVVLKAQAYTIKCDEFQNIIQKINGGILKEVSISCQIEKKLCSICNKEFENCYGHELKKTYNEQKCFIKLVNPLDAFEWSFVPVPAQKGARIVKHFSLNAPEKTAALQNDDAEIGRQQKIELKKQITKLSFLCGFEESETSTFHQILNKLNFYELQQLKSKFESILSKKNFKPMLSTDENLQKSNFDKTNLKNYLI